MSCEAPSITDIRGGYFDSFSTPLVVSFNVSNNNVDFSDTGAQFYYEAPNSVTALFPSRGDKQGGTVVRVNGSYFRDTAQLACSFGDHSGLVPATYLGHDAVDCVSPPHNNKQGSVFITVQSTATVHEIQQISIVAGSSVTGVFLLSFQQGSEVFWTSPIVYNANSSVLRSAIQNNLTVVGDVEVSEPTCNAFDACRWNISFVSRNDDVEYLGTDSIGLQGTDVYMTVAEVIRGGPSSTDDGLSISAESQIVSLELGSYEEKQINLKYASADTEQQTLTVSTVKGDIRIKVGGNETEPLDPNDPHADQLVLNALKNLYIKGKTDFAINTVAEVASGADNSTSFLLTFEDGIGNVPATTAYYYDVATWMGEADSLVTAVTLTNGTFFISGSFTLSMGDTITAPIDFDASASKVDEICEEAFSAYIPISVTKSASEGETTWFIAFSISAGDVPDMSVDERNIAGSNVFMTSETLVDGSADLNGTYSVTFDGKSVAIACDASASEIKVAVGTLAPVSHVENADAWLVSQVAVWRVSFQTDQGNLPLMVADSHGTWDTGNVLVYEDVNGTYIALSGTWGISVTNEVGDITSTTLLYDADEAAVLAAFAILLPAETCTVERFLTPNAGYEGYSWLVGFSSWYSYDITLDSTQLIGSSPSATVVTETFAEGPDVIVRVTNNGLDFSDTGQIFKYDPAIVAWTISPQSGPPSGGSIVRIKLFPVDLETGKIITLDAGSDEILIRFGNTYVEGAIIDSSTIECVTPPNDEGIYEIELSLNYVEFSSSDVTFEFAAEIVIDYFSPRNGPVNGGTVVTLYGGPFRETDAVQCQFGEQMVEATNVSTTSLQCVSPEVGWAQSVALEVTNNAQDFTSTTVQYVYEEALAVFEIEPTTGPETGKTPVVVTGGIFANETSNLLCKFGDFTSQATWLSSSQVICEAPASAATNEVQQISTEVSATIYEIQLISVSALPPSQEEYSWSTSGNGPLIEDIQRIAVSAYMEHEVQELRICTESAGSTVQKIESQVSTVSPQVLSLATIVDDTRHEIQNITTQAFGGVGKSFAINEVQQITASGSSNGTFSISYEGLERTVGLSTTSVQLESILQDLGISNVTISRKASDDSFSVTTTWLVTFYSPQDPVQLQVISSTLEVAASTIIPNARNEMLELYFVGNFSTVSIADFVMNDTEDVIQQSGNIVTFSSINAIAVQEADDVSQFSDMLQVAVQDALEIDSVSITKGVWNTTYRSWLISSLSAAGTLGSLSLDIVGQELESVVTTSGVLTALEATSEKLGGQFAIEIRSLAKVSNCSDSTLQDNVEFSHDVSALDMQWDLINALCLDNPSAIAIERSNADNNNGYTWTLTFPEARGDVDLIVINGSALTGTLAQVSSLVVQNGSEISGGYLTLTCLNNADLTQIDVMHDESNLGFATKLFDSGIFDQFEGNVSVNTTIHDFGQREWLIVLPEVVADDPNTGRIDCEASTSHLQGTGIASIAIQDVHTPSYPHIIAIEATGDTDVFFSLIFSDMDFKSGDISIQATALDVQLELETEFGVVEVSVEGSESSGKVWTIAFVDVLGPINVGVALVSGSADDLTITTLREGSGERLSGIYKLGIDEDDVKSNVHGSLSLSATPSQVELYVETLDGIDDVVVSRSERSLNGEYSWSVTFLAPRGPVNLLVADITPDSEYVSASIDASFDVIGTASEVQEIRATTGSVFNCSFGSAVSDTMSASSSTFEVKVALEAMDTLGTIDVSLQVSNDTDTVWRITFEGNVGDVALLDCGSNIKVMELVASTSDSLGGSFAIEWDGENAGREGTAGFVVSNVPFDVTAAELEDLLREGLYGDDTTDGAGGVPDYDDITVIDILEGDVEHDEYHRCRAFNITFNRYTADVPNLEVIATDLTGTNLAVDVTEVVEVTTLYGAFTLTFDGESTTALSIDATANDVQAALEKLSNIDLVSVTRELPPNSNTLFDGYAGVGCWNWVITFLPYDYDQMTMTQNAGDQSPIIVDFSDLGGPRDIYVNVSTEQQGGYDIAGGFYFRVEDGSEQLMSATINWDDSVSVIQRKFEAAFGYSVLVSISAEYDNGGMDFVMVVQDTTTYEQYACINNATFMDALGRNCETYEINGLCSNFAFVEHNGSSVTDFADDSGIDASIACCACHNPIEIIDAFSLGSVSMVEMIDLGNSPLNGTFRIEVPSEYNDGGITDPLPYNASVLQMESALQNLLGEVEVSRQPMYDGMDGYIWTITFLENRNQNPTLSRYLRQLGEYDIDPHPTVELVVDYSDLNGTQLAVEVDVEQYPGSNEVQFITSSAASPIGGVFSLVYPVLEGGTTGNLTYDVSAAEMKFAIEAAMPSLGSVNVSRYSLANGMRNEYQWVVFFSELAGDIERLTTITDHLTGDQADVIVTETDGTTELLSGSFTLKYGNCTEFSTYNCTTPPIEYDATAAELKSALEFLTLIPGDLEIEQTDSNFDGSATWLITFIDSGDVDTLEPDSTLMTGADLVLNVKETLKGHANSVGYYPVEVSSNGQDFSTSGVLYRYHGEVGVTGLSPDHGTLYGMTEVSVIGHGFENSSLLYCRFGTGHESVVPAIDYISSTEITCISPPSLLTGSVAVQVSNNGFSDLASFSESTTLFVYDEAIEPFDVIPPLGPVSGNTSTRIVGNGFLNTNELQCRFGNLVVAAVWISREEIRCQTPTGTDVPGYYPIEVSNNGQDFTQYAFPFYFYPDAALERITPVSGPALVAGTEVIVYGRNFVNSTYLSCRFDALMTPAIYLSDTKIMCPTPAMQYGLDWLDLSQVSNREPNPFTLSRKLFPTAHAYPFYWSKNVPVETSNNAQDFTNSGIHFLFQQDAEVTNVYPKNGRDTATTPLFVQGSGFVNSTQLTCRIGHNIVRAVFITSELVLCFAPPQSTSEPEQGSHRRRGLRRQSFMHADGVSTYGETPSQVFVEISNNLLDWSVDWQQFEYLEPCQPGYYCPNHRAVFECPRGTFCPGTQNYNFTLCPRGTYQPHAGQANCLRCPIGYQCPYEGMPVPQICPAGFVCEVTGVEIADQPCPEGHYCHEGTATTATTCGNPEASNYLFPTMSHAERSSTISLGRTPQGNNLVLGARNTACWSNATEDFGLQTSPYPQRFWMELHLLPLASDASFSASRGRYCLDDACIRAQDMDNITVSDYAFKYDAAEFTLRRPVPCPAGTFCGPGTAAIDIMMSNFTTPQFCQENMYCPEGAPTPQGLGECPVGFYCPLSVRLPCPVGTYCPREGHGEPLPCPPGKFNAMTTMASCSKCPRGYICPGFGRIDPAICPAGYVCSRESLTSPNIRCPKGFYCPNGTMTSDPFRNDTTLRPYPCAPGSFCMGGVVADTIVEGDYSYPQPCAEGFHCEAGSTNAKGRGLCPKGFSCPKGTAVPVPTPVGYFAELEGVIEPAQCRPGYYTPTIQSVYCYDCPPGTQCQNDGDSVATVCPPGTYRSEYDNDGVMCTGCPQGTFSKNWELRSSLECSSCPTGTVCPTDGMSSPCGLLDTPKSWEPTDVPYSETQCNYLGDGYVYGHLDPTRPWAIDSRGRGPFMVRSEHGQCFFNDQPNGTVVYQRLRDYFGSMYHLERGHDHQGYGTDEYQGEFGYGSRYIDLREGNDYAPPYKCIPGMRLLNYSRGGDSKDQWYPGTCEADIMCNFDSAADMNPCSEGYFCYERTTSLTAVDNICKAGYVCDFGSTPDVTLNAPQGQYNQLCPTGYYCPEGTGAGQQYQYPCPDNYFCPTGTADPWLGLSAQDSFHRLLNVTMADPFLYMNNTGMPGGLPEIFGDDFSAESTDDDSISRRRLSRRLTQDSYLGGYDPQSPNVYIGDDPSVARYVQLPEERVEQRVSSHDQRCFNGINETKKASHEERFNLSMVDVYPNQGFFRQNLATANDEFCARDHKWKSIYNAIDRDACDCKTQFRVVLQMYDWWRCTHPDSADSLQDCSFQFDYESNQSRALITQTCEWDGELQNITSCTSSECDDADSDCEAAKVRVRIAWREMGYFTTFSDMHKHIDAEFAAEYDEKRYGDRESFDPYVFDLNYATEQVTLLRNDIPEWFYTYSCSSDDPKYHWQYDSLNAYYYKHDCEQHENEPIRLDMCRCEHALRCPNGTLSEQGQENIYDCVTFSELDGESATDDILLRMPVFEKLSTQGMSNASDMPSEYGLGDIYMDGDWSGEAENPITGTFDGMGYLSLKGWDVVTLTFDNRFTHVNLTYGTHFRFAMYPNCRPCPVRYICDGPALQWDAEQSLDTNAEDAIPYEDTDDDPNNNYCSFPPLVDQQRQIYNTTLYDNSLLDNEEGCEDRNGVEVNGQVYQGCGAELLEASEAPEGWPTKPVTPDGTGIFCEDCCSCQPHQMPYFFTDTSHNDEYFPQYDNKHVMIQISIGTLQDTDVTVALELLHGNFLAAFQDITMDQFDATFFSPSRSDMIPNLNFEKVDGTEGGNAWNENHYLGSYTSFLAYVYKDLYEDRMSMPLNWPVTKHPIIDATIIEEAIFIDRIADLYIGDPTYVDRQECRYLNSEFKNDGLDDFGIPCSLEPQDTDACNSYEDIQGREFQYDAEFYYWRGDYAGYDENDVAGPLKDWELQFPEYQQLYSICQNQEERNKLSGCEGYSICSYNALAGCDGPNDVNGLCQTLVPSWFDDLETVAYESERTSTDPSLGAWLDDDPLITDGSGYYFDRGYLLTVPTPVADVSLDSAWFGEGGEYSSEVTFLTLPYLPHFSNCEGYGQHIYIAKLLEEHKDCSRPLLKDTMYVEGFDFLRLLNFFLQFIGPSVLGEDQNIILDYTDMCGEPDPSVYEPGGILENDADSEAENWLEDARTDSIYRGIELKCRYEESLISVDPYPRWYEMPNGEEIFYLTKYPVPYRKKKETSYPDYSPDGIVGNRAYQFEKDKITAMPLFRIDDPDIPIYGSRDVTLDDMECFFLCREQSEVGARR
jgi:hypothetical protein